MSVRVNTGDACVVHPYENEATAWAIKQPVGKGGVNRKDDVLTIQGLFNLIEPRDGGPAVPLAEDGQIGPKTTAAIAAFQRFHHTAHDSRIDPKGPTLKKMNEVPKRKLAAENAARMARARAAMPDLIAMARKAIRTAEAARDFAQLGPGSLTASKRSYDLAGLYFAFGEQPQPLTLDDLGFIRTTFQRVLGVLTSPPSPVTGGNPLGVSVFAADPRGRDRAASTPTQAWDGRQPVPGVHSGHVYLGRKLDDKVPDLFAHVLMHELLHFVDDESRERRIGDHGYREKAMRLPHPLRMHTSDNYAMFASHAHFGRARLVASQPTLGPVVPEGT